MLELRGEVIVLKVLYLDVFFLINLTVDLLSLFFATRILHIKTNMVRLIGISVLGSISAVIDVFLADINYLRPINSAVFLVFAAVFISSGIGALRRIKLVLVFVLIELVLGGLVYYGYGLLDRYFSELDEYFSSGAENRKALIFSIIILLAIGVLKLLITIFSSHAAARAVNVRIRICEYVIQTDALIDSGNLVKDPMNMNPVMFLKPELAREVLPQEITELSELDALREDLRRRVRLVPVSRGEKTQIMTGIRADSVEIITEKGCEQVSLTVVIDREGGKFGGYDALIPLDAVQYA